MKRVLLSKAAPVTLMLLAGVLAVSPARGGSIFLTGHDPDFHALIGNTTGAQNINDAAISFIMDSAFNPFVAGGDQHILFVECDTCTVPGGHVDGASGFTASAGGFPSGTTFETHGAADGLATELTQLGTKYSAIVIGSDFGGMLTQAELDILNADSTGIISFLNSGGGLYAMAETSPAEGGLASSGFYGFLPFVVSSSPVNQAETGNTLTPFGMSLGLLDSDINGNFSHSVFTSTGGLNIVDSDPGNEILSLAGRGNVTTGGVGVVPEPNSFRSLLLLGIFLLGAAPYLRRKIKSA
jgi:hypothetical protein